ncbi:DoxX family protein [Fodinibius sediminis]|uniref:DoxX-like family protein n=1 Tax=Fodinibius sediminis TaxID=1214077 RepID=A0A521E658_9BACT|nr:DoxX family protein [Fodinibius sediminis]SMO79379.1 DoxX-like family protein [Fodinibius sediminis]
MKKIKIAYWTVTILFALAMLQSGIVQLIPTEGSKEVMTLLGYPIYLLTILAIAKLLGAVVLVMGRFKTLKEWAYAGFAFDFIGASASGAYIGEIQIIIGPLVFLAVMFLSYYLWKRMEQLMMSPTQK